MYPVGVCFDYFGKMVEKKFICKATETIKWQVTKSGPYLIDAMNRYNFEDMPDLETVFWIVNFLLNNQLRGQSECSRVYVEL